jgi:hypothetical protein
MLDPLFRGRDTSLPYGMFDAHFADSTGEARRAKRLESIYHVGQSRVWNGQEVLAELVAKHGPPKVDEGVKQGLAGIFSILMWGELAAWKISAQLADGLVPLEAKLAATSQVHDEARHFYVMHDYLDLLGVRPAPLDAWARRVVEMTLKTNDPAKKLMGMQLMIETIALTIFQCVRDKRIEPVLTDLLGYFERDEARHVGLGMQLLPPMIDRMSATGRASLAAFQIRLLTATLGSLKGMEADLRSVGIEPRQVVELGLRKALELDTKIQEDFPTWGSSKAVDRVFDALTEGLFPRGGHDVPLATRVVDAVRIAYAPRR